MSIILKFLGIEVKSKAKETFKETLKINKFKITKKGSVNYASIPK